MTEADTQRIIDRISYKEGWELKYSWNKEDRYIQWIFDDPHAGHQWSCRKWRISPHMTVSELIQTAFLAVMSAEEHEAREAFKYKGVAVLGPHWDLNEYANNIIQGYVREDVRESIET
jgi:hypothetical protein